MTNLNIDRALLTNKVKFCEKCDRNVTVRKDGSCVHGHSPRNLRRPVPITKCPECRQAYKWKKNKKCPSCGAEAPPFTIPARIGFKVGMFIGRRKSVYI